MPGGLHDNQNRYLYLLVPLLLIGLANLRQHPTYRGLHWRKVLIVAAALYAVATTPVHFGRYVGDIAFTRVELEGVADWIRRVVPHDARIAVHDAGYLAFATDRPLIDIVGLKTPEAQRVHAARTAPSGGADRGVALAQIVVETKADYLVVLRRWDQTFAITAGLRSAGVQLIPVRMEGEYWVFRVPHNQSSNPLISHAAGAGARVSAARPDPF
jgi:hypothetical protein